MLGPMAGIAILLAVGGSWAIEELVEAVNDRILNAASRAIAESLAVEDGEITLDLPPSVFAMLENAERDNVYYSITYANQVISGYGDMPKIGAPPKRDGEVAFGKSKFRGHRVRIVAEVRRLPRIDGLVTVQVAETMGARDRAARQMLLSLAVLEALLIGLTALLLPIAVRWGLSPLLQLRNEMDRRSASDFTPLSTSKVPIELRDFVGAFNSLLERLEVAVKGMRRFTADASHQMRTPLTILRTHVTALQKARLDSDDAKASLADIEHATERLQNLLVQLLALARADSAAPVRQVVERLNIVEVVRDVANDHAASALKRKASLQFSSDADDVAILGHPTLVGELISNLLDNAIRYSEKNGLVLIQIVEVGSSVKVIIDDNGPGIPEADRERAFERFTRLNPNKDRNGTGLGLPIVRALAETIGAEVVLADTESGKGLRAVVTFPKAPNP